MKLYVHVQRLTVLAGCCSIYIYIYICITPLIFVVGRAWGRSSHLGLEKRWSATMRGNLVCFPKGIPQGGPFSRGVLGVHGRPVGCASRVESRCQEPWRES